MSVVVEQALREIIAKQYPQINEILIITCDDDQLTASIGNRNVVIQFISATDYYILLDDCIDVGTDPLRISYIAVERLMCLEVSSPKYLVRQLIFAVFAGIISILLGGFMLLQWQSAWGIPPAYLGAYLFAIDVPKWANIVRMNKLMRDRTAKRSAIREVLRVLPIPIRRECAEHIPEDATAWG